MGLAQFVRADLIPDKRKDMVSAHHRVIPRLMTIPPAYSAGPSWRGYPTRSGGTTACARIRWSTGRTAA